MAKIRLFAAIAIAIGLSLAVAQAQTPRDTLVVAKPIDDTISLDPAWAYEHSGAELITNVYERVMRFEPEDVTKLVGGAVERWTVSGDGKTFEFKLRPGQTFHSGNPLTSEDVVFSLQRVVKLNKTPAYLITQLGWTPENVEKLIVAKDRSTFELSIATDFSPSLVLNVLSSGVASIVDKKLTLANEKDGDLGSGWLRANSAGSGPFILRAWRPNESFTLEAFAGYRTGAPKVRRIIIRHVSEAASQRILLERSDIDIARSLTPDILKGLSGNADIAINGYRAADVHYIALNQKFEPFRNPDVRQALRYLVDYQGMVDSFLKDQYSVHQAFWPSGFYASLDDTPYRLDVDKAKALLLKAGYPNGFTFKFNVRNATPFIEIAQSLKDTMAKAGVTLDIVQSDMRQVITAYRGRQHEASFNNWIPDFRDPHSHADTFARNPDNSDDAKSKTAAWRNTWEIPEITGSADAAVKERDVDKRAAMYVDLQRRLQADSPYIFMVQGINQIASRKQVKGIVMDPTSGVLYYRLVAK